MMTDDMALLREFAASQSGRAFETLVARHISLVHSAALRKTGDAHLAEEITQAVFIILARKAKSLGEKTILSGWLYRTAQFAAADALKIQRRRQRREQEAYMQSQLDSQQSDLSRQSEATAETWNELAPILDEAMMRLRQADRDAIVLRYFENKNLREVGDVLGLQERAAQKRIARALEKLRAFFEKRGVSSTTAIIAGAISANSVQAAPVALTKTISAVAITKGAAVSTSTLTFVKGALKIMAWTKMKTAIVAGAIVLLAAETTTVTVKEIQEHRTYPWQVENANSDILRKTPPQVAIVPSKFPNSMGAGSFSVSSPKPPYSMQSLGIGQPFGGIISLAYGQSDERTIFSDKIPSGKFDYIANLPSGNEETLRKEIERKFGLVGRRELRDTDVLLLEVQNPNATGLQFADPKRLEPHSGSSSRSGAGYYSARSVAVSSLAWFLEYHFQTPVIDQTGLTNRFDIDLKWDETDFRHPNLDALKQALLDQLGLELVPTNMPIEMLIVEKAK